MAFIAAMQVVQMDTSDGVRLSTPPHGLFGSRQHNDASEESMTVAVQIDFKGATLEQYDQGLEGAGLLPGGPSPPGQLFHFVIKVDDGIRVIDVWESRDAYETFARSSIIPVAREVGMPDAPEVQLFDVHSYFASRRLRP